MSNVGPTVWYVRDNAPTSTIGWSAVTAWPSNTAKAAGVVIRQNATPSVGNERVFVAIVAGTTTNGTEPTWTVTKGAKTTDNTVTWQECTGQPGVNGDTTNSPTWTQNKNTAVTLGLIVYDSTSGALQIVSTAGTTGNGSQPTFSATAGVTTSDNTVTWTSLGAASNFSAWAAPHARLNNAFTTNWGAAGNTFYVGNDHAETESGSYIPASPGLVATPCFIYSVDHTASFPLGSSNLSAGASLAITGNGTISMTGSAYYYGVTLQSSGANNGTFSLCASNGAWQRWDSCTIKKAATSSNTISFPGGGGARLDLVNTTFQFGNTSDTLSSNSGNAEWRNTASAIQGSTFPTNLISLNNAETGEIVFEGVDLSALGSGKTIVGGTLSSGQHVHLIDCTLGASVTIAATPVSQGGKVNVVRCDTSGTDYAQHRYAYEGTLDHETTVVRTGGASDGTTTISWKITTTANSKWVTPFVAFPISIWNAKTAANVTVSVYGIWAGGSVPNTDDIWIDVEYLGASGSPLASLASGTKSNNLATGSAWTTDGSTWGGSTTPFKMSVTLSAPQPQLAGYMRVYVKAAKLSSIFYIDPSPILS